jgi:DNA-binding LacI/PurR family transcriptional regulator
VGAIIPSVNSVFFMDLVNAIRSEILPHGFHFFLSPVSGREEFLHMLLDFAARRCRAVLFVPPDDDIAIPAEVASGDVLLASLANPCAGEPAHFLGPDEVRTGRDAVDYLAGMGHTRILHVTYARRAHAVEARAGGYSEAMRERGLTPVVLRPLESEVLRQSIEEHRATALFCHNDWLALSAMRLLEAQGLRIPEDISVLGVDNSPTFVELCPGLTTMNYPAADIARCVRELLTEGRVSGPISPCAVVERHTVRRLTSRDA